MTLAVRTRPARERATELAPEAFSEDRPLHYWGGLWRDECDPLDGATAARAVRAGLNEHRTWSLAPLGERTTRVLSAVDELTAHRAVLAALLAEQTSTGADSADSADSADTATAAIDRALDGVREHTERISEQLAGRVPLRGPVSNLAGRDCPAPVLVHAMLVQALAGNAAIVRAPERGGTRCLALAVALAARHGLPLTLVAGGGAGFEAALTRLDVVGCVSYPVDAERGAALVHAVTRRAPQ